MISPRAIALALVAVTTAAHAAPPIDPDLATEAHSGFWDEAAHPGTAARRGRVADAVRALRVTSIDLATVERDLATLTVEAPELADAWGYLAITAERRRRWSVCAEAYPRAFALAPAWRPESLITQSPPRGLVRAPILSVLLCQTRAGDFTAARVTLERALAAGETGSELWLRAGEIAMAQGRLVDAADAFGRSTEPSAAWLLVVALDRARHDADAEAAAERAGRDDPFGARAASNAQPMAPASDADYLLALAARARNQADFAAVYLRRYLAQPALAAPWRARAEEHLAIAHDVPSTGATVQGSAVDTASSAALRDAIEPSRARLAVCMREVPTGLAELRVTVAGPPPPPPPRRRPAPRPVTTGRRPTSMQVDPFAVRTGRPSSVANEPGVSAYYLLAPFESGEPAARDRALRCLEQVGTTMKLPAPPPGGWAQVRIPVRSR